MSESDSKTECIFCRASADTEDEKNLVLLRGEHSFVILNAYPYTTGHLMIAPYAHLATLEKASSEILLEMMQIAQKCLRALKKDYRPNGFNLGFNLGRSAGAGVEGHFHLHIVPRWEGDTNFMAVIGNVRVMPEKLKETYRRLSQQLQK